MTTIIVWILVILVVTNAINTNNDCILHAMQYLPLHDQILSRLVCSQWNAQFRNINRKHKENVRTLINYAWNSNQTEFDDAEIIKIYQESKFDPFYLSVIPTIINKLNTTISRHKQLLHLLHITAQNNLTETNEFDTIITVLINVSRKPLIDKRNNNVVWKSFYELTWNYLHHLNNTFPSLQSVYSSKQLTSQQQKHIETLIDNGLLIWYFADSVMKWIPTHNKTFCWFLHQIKETDSDTLVDDNFFVNINVVFLLKLFEYEYYDLTCGIRWSYGMKQWFDNRLFDVCSILISGLKRFDLLEKLIFAFNRNNGLAMLRSNCHSERYHVFQQLLKYLFQYTKRDYIGFLEILIRSVSEKINANISTKIAENIYLFRQGKPVSWEWKINNTEYTHFNWGRIMELLSVKLYPIIPHGSLIDFD